MVSKTVAAFAVALAVAGVVPPVLGENKAWKDSGVQQITVADTKGQHQDLQASLKELQQARRQLALANRGVEGRRAQALEQTDYAIEQVYASLGDDAAKARDQKTAAREVEAGRDRWAKEKAELDRASGTAREEQKGELKQETRKQLETALRHLRSAKDRLGDVSSEVHRDKALVFTNQAIADVQRGLNEVK